MSQKTDAQLTTDANVIGNETTPEANTADRVRDHLVDQIDSKINNDKIIDEDDMVSNSATHVPTQQSVKAYVDASGGSGHVIEDEGTPVTQRANMNFVGAGVNVSDAGGKTVVTIPASISDEAYDATTWNGVTDVAPSKNAVRDKIESLSLGSGGHVIEDEGTPLTQRANMNFVGAGVTATDAGGKTVITIPGGSGHSIEDEGTPVTARPKLNFVGPGVTVTDDSGDDASVVTIPSQVSDTAYDATSWNGVTDIAPSKNAVRDKIEAIDNIGVQDLWVGAASMLPRVTNGCSQLTRIEIATSLFNIQVLAFDQTTQEFAQFQFSLPPKYNNSTITVTPVWTAIAGSGTVQWGVSFGSYRNDDPLTAAFGTPQTSDDTLLAINDLHKGPDTAAITPAGTLEDGNFMGGQISRNPASDTLNADALLLGLILHVTVDAGKDG